jgi:hypothetical protein
MRLIFVLSVRFRIAQSGIEIKYYKFWEERLAEQIFNKFFEQEYNINIHTVIRQNQLTFRVKKI